MMRVDDFPDGVVVVGGGLAAVSAARRLREGGYDGLLTILGQEPDLPYDRPPLSKGYLTGAVSRERLALVDPSWYQEQRVSVRTDAVVASVDAQSRRLQLRDGEQMPWSCLLVTTGGVPRNLGPVTDRIAVLRTRRDADRLRALLKPGQRLLVLGGGLIGGEVAAVARLHGMEVTVLEALPAVFARSLGPWLADRVAALHCDHGVALHAGVRVRTLEDSPEGVRAHAEDGRVFDADVALIGFGLVPAAGVLERAGAQVDDGVVVDTAFRTSLPGVYAAGDVARRCDRRGRGVRSEHWQAATRSGASAAEAILTDVGGAPIDRSWAPMSSQPGSSPPMSSNPPEAPWFWTDQYGRNFQVSGDPTVGERAVIRGSDGPDFLCFLLDAGGAVRAAVACDRARELRLAQQLVRRHAVIDPHVLADDTQDLRRLARRGS